MHIEDLFLERCVVVYDGNKYAYNPLYMLGARQEDFNLTTINEIPAIVDYFCSMEENDDLISLKFGKIIFDLDEGNPKFSTNYTKVISFDKKTQRGVGDKITVDDLKQRSFDVLNKVILSNYIGQICKTNSNVYEFFKRKNLKFENFLLYYTPLMNMLNIVTFNLLELEKLINSKNENILLEGLNDENFELNEASKLHQVVGLPKVAIAAIKDLKLEFAMNEIRALSETIDGNSLRIFFEFLSNFKVILKNNKTLDESRITKFIEDFIEVSKKGYRTPDLLRYVMRQNFYYSLEGVFSFPFAQMGYLKDYIHMSDLYGVKVEKYPSQLKKQHDILANNVKFFDKMSPVLEQKFMDAVDLYKEVEKEIVVNLPCEKGETPKKEAYVFVVPTCIKDIIQEGSDLHHCVGSYSDRIIEGKSRIVFMRLKDAPKESLVTIDISKDKKLIEAAGMGNGELTDIQEKALKAWLKEIA